jgi:hypothetical protein
VRPTDEDASPGTGGLRPAAQARGRLRPASQAPGAEPAEDARTLTPEQVRRRYRLRAIIAAAVVVLVAAGGLTTAYFTGAFADEGRFEAAVKPCTLVDRELAWKIVPQGVFTETGDLCSVDNFDAPDSAKFTLVSNAAHRDGRVGAAEVASRYVGRVFTGVGQRESGLGDEAVSFQPAGSRTIILVMRVDNALVTLTGSNPATAAESPAAAVRDIARDAARRMTD